MLANTGLKCYSPEMKEKKPIAQIQATLSHYGKHYYLKTPLELRGRGINFLSTFKSSDLTPHAQFMTGWNEYKVTENAFETICKKYAVSMELLLD
jgi:hypothetical protein